VAIARALVKSPTLVIADEPTANLDTATASHVIDLMKDLGHRHGATFLIATHDDRMTAHCDQVRAITDGVLQ
jgi:putative ABC transport system ATP-binding protein